MKRRLGQHDAMYSPMTLEHFRRPRNLGRARGFVGLGRARSRSCDDRLEITVALQDGRVIAGFRAQGCSACIAAASMLTEMVNSTRHDAATAVSIDAAAIASALQQVPEDKLRCVRLAPVALARALDDARTRSTPSRTQPSAR